MEIKDLKMLFDNGALKAATVTEEMMGSGYVVVFNAKNKSHQYHISGQRTKGEPRVFKTIDAAVKNAYDIGFRTVTVSLP
ncbi:plasmid replication protein RepB [Pseudoalteromonas sp.]|uniref:plasmid replication protein RepB n=1 Tax=Pseudoalteromonas sp. TaxID=53249 RepID=UPI002603C7EA|nr:plasmid replication protein RepB [Pseudoalteromonas sp.]MCP4588392.1 plasmid replication protein RepB [Pseudoalteromonas sp.]